MTMHCNNQTAIHIAGNPVFHERTRHIEVDYHFIREIMTSKKVLTPCLKSEYQLGVFTKALGRKLFSVMCSKLGLNNIYALA